MNCKPGDLAVVVMGSAQGSIVRCIERYDGPWAQAQSMPGWRVEWQRPRPDLWDMVVDFALRPIHDPGDDVPDESTAWLPPVPLHDEVTA